MKIKSKLLLGIMTHHENWQKVGLGESGETYLVSPDKKMRSASRFMLESPKDYLELMSDIADNELVQELESKGTSIGIQIVDTEGVRDAALSGTKNQTLINDYRGIPVVSAYHPLEVEGLDWVIMSEIDEEEALAPAISLKKTIFLLV